MGSQGGHEVPAVAGAQWVKAAVIDECVSINDLRLQATRLFNVPQFKIIEWSLLLSLWAILLVNYLTG